MLGMAQGQTRRWTVAIAALLMAVIACGIGLWLSSRRARLGHDSPAVGADTDGQWTAVAERARKTLAVDGDNPEALRLLARAWARLGRDADAIAIYQRRLGEKALEAEDHFVLGLMHQRHGRAEAAAGAWKKVVDAPGVSPPLLEEVARLCARGKLFDLASQATERLSREPGWEARGSLMLGTIRLQLNNVPDAAALFRRAINLDPALLDASHDPTPLRKVIARTFLRLSSPDLALPLLQSILGQAPDSEAAWLMSRAYLQAGDKALALAALEQAGTYRALNPLEPEPGPYVGESRCEKCHTSIFRDSLTSRHTQSYSRGQDLERLPIPGRPLPDPDDAEVTHTFQRRDGALRAETRVGIQVFESVIEYAFGTADRYLTMVGRDPNGRYHMSRLSYYQTAEGNGWDRTTLDMTHPTRARPAEFLGETIGVRDGLAKCLYCHVTNPRTGDNAVGPEMADRAIGCERCHGPGGNHLAAVQAGLRDLAIVSPANASPQVVTTKQCNDCHVLEHKIRDDDPENSGWVRSQGVGWTRSRCNTESGGAFGCVTCHEPHQSAHATTTAEYESKCLKCHSVAGQTTCSVNLSEGCVQCHMPRVRIDSLHMDLTDHHIRIHRAKR
jgi:predicted CXXCH cytochrome family protein